MKTRILILGSLITIFLMLSGCYTQLGTVRESKTSYQEEYTYDNQDYESDTLSDADETTIINNYYYMDGYWYPRYRWMFSYYYPSYYWPSFAFQYVYHDPWFYDWYWDRYWYYDPLYWCYTPWVSYPIYYPPYYWSYPWYYVTRDGDIISKRRDFGSQRGSSQTERSQFDRGNDGFGIGRTGVDVTPATGITGGGRSQSSSPDQIRGKSRSSETGRSYIPRTGERSGSNRGETQRPPSRRERYEQPRGGDNNKNTDTDRSRNNENREGTRIYTPPAPTPQPSSPPPSSPPPSRGGDSRGGSSNDNNSSRGGNSRGGR